MKNLAVKATSVVDLFAMADFDVKHMMIKHIKDKHDRYVATFLAVAINDKEVKVSWSKCHRLDKEKNKVNRISSKKKGLQIAMNKLIYGSKVPVAETIKDRMADFLSSIVGYYRDKNVIAPVGMDT